MGWYREVYNSLREVVYGEIEPLVSIGDTVSIGSILGKVQQVLKNNKGLPTSMVHIESYSKLIDPVIWKHNESKPEYLEYPTLIIKFANYLNEKNYENTN